MPPTALLEPLTAESCAGLRAVWETSSSSTKRKLPWLDKKDTIPNAYAELSKENDTTMVGCEERATYPTHSGAALSEIHCRRLRHAALNTIFVDLGRRLHIVNKCPLCSTSCSSYCSHGMNIEQKKVDIPLLVTSVGCAKSSIVEDVSCLRQNHARPAAS